MNSAYMDLANAIVIQAAKDYKKALRTLMRDPHDRSAQYHKRDLERFFRSGWCAALTDVNPELLIERIKRKVVNDDSKRISGTGK